MNTTVLVSVRNTLYYKHMHGSTQVERCHVKLTGPRPKHRFIRFGLIPEDERSLNHKTKRPEPGVSVFDCLIYPHDQIIVLPNRYAVDKYNRLLRLLPFDYTDERSDVFLLDGTVAGIGSDGEPCLRNITDVEPYNLVVHTRPLVSICDNRS